MLTKRSLVVVLAGLNLFLLAALLASSYSPPAAFAQTRGGRPGDYALVTAKPQGQSYDVVYLLDKQERRLHAWYPINPQFTQFGYAQFRDLDKDFEKK